MMKRIKIGPLDLYGCQEAHDLQDDYIDGEIEPLEAKKVRTHLKICRLCANKFRFEELFLREFRTKMGATEMPQYVEQGVIDALNEEKNS